MTQISKPAKVRLSFAYSTPVVAALAAGNSASVNITFDQDSHFIWSKSVYFVDLSGAAITDNDRPIPLITVAMVDTASGRQINNVPVPLDTIAGYKASEPFLLPLARTLLPNATMRFTFTNYSTATTYTNLYMVLHGVKQYT